MKDSNIGLAERLIFKLRNFNFLIPEIRKLYWRSVGMVIGNGTKTPKMYVTWPHQVKLGSNCRIEHNIYFHFDGIHKPGPSIIIGDGSFIGNNCEFNITKYISIGENALIAAGCRFIDHDHCIEGIGEFPRKMGLEEPITLEDSVWLGVNVVVLKGVKIGKGAVVAAGAVVTKSIPSNEIWGGVPARKIGNRSS